MRVDGALLAGLYCIALALRLVPLLLSPLPYNIDGFALARIAEDMGASGSWSLDEGDPNAYNLKMPAYPAVWSSLAQLAGLHPLAHLQAAMAAVTAAVVLPAYLLGLRLSAHRGVALASGLFAAAFGSFLFLTSAIMKESIGLLVLPVVVLLFHERRDPRKRALALLLLLVLPFLHHLTTLMALGMVVALLALDVRRALARGRLRASALALDVATGPAAALPAWAYYDAVDMPFFREVTSAGDLLLFLAIAMLLSAAAGRMSRPAPRRPRASLALPSAFVLLVPLAAFGGLLANAGTGLFAGAVGTRPALLATVPALLVLAALMLVGFTTVRRTTGRMGDVLVAMLAAPTALILFGLLRGLDPFGLVIVYRAFDFMDYALAVLVGVGLAVLVPASASIPARFLAGAAVLVAALVATAPIAYDSQAAFGVENVTTPAEFEALSVLAALGARNVTTDQRLANLAEWWFGIPGDPSLPLRLREGENVRGFEYALVLGRWTTVGAQIHPAPNVVLAREDLASFLSGGTVVFSAGPAGDRLFVVRLVP